MKAMILAAGLGTRLRPLTDDRPKALVEVGGRTILEIALARLRAFGIREVIINVHHFADMILDYLHKNRNFSMRIEVSREDILLDTGGGLKKASGFFLENPREIDTPFLLHNVDVISTIGFQSMLESHNANRALATLAVQQRDTSRYLLFDDQLELCGRRSSRPSDRNERRREPSESPNANKDEIVRYLRPGTRSQALAFCGIHIISPRLLSLITEEGIFSIITTYLRLAAQREKISAFRVDQFYWRDLGRPDDLRQAAKEIAAQQTPG
jgi:NDP-sugar pyrophosphorylase family protein